MAAKGNKANKVVEKSDERTRNTAIWIEALDDFVDQMNDWEKGFFANVSDWFLNKEGRLSPSQYEHLEKLYRKFY